MLLVDHFPFRQIGSPVLCESSHTPGNQVYRVSGVFQNYLRKNQNGRIYPKSIWERVLAPDSDFSNRLKRRNVLGHIEHPADGQTRLKESSHVITEVWIATPKEISESNGLIEEGDILGTYEVLPDSFPDARMLRGAIAAKIDFGGVSSRGNGAVTETMDGLIVNDDYMLETWDVVFNPSVSRAKPTLKSESVISEEKTTPQTTEKKTEEKEEPTKTESMKVTESSFVLVSGLYGPGKATEEKKFIPIRLISDKTSNNFFWESANNRGPKLGKFSEFNEAMYALKSHCESTGNVFTPSPISESEFEKEEEEEGKKVPPPPPHEVTVESTPTKTMEPATRILNIQNEAIALATTDKKRLKLSEAASLLHKSKTLRSELIQIVESNKHLSIFADPISKRLVEFEDDLEADAPPPPPPPDADGAGAPPPPDAGGGAEATPEEAVVVLDKALSALRDCGQEEVAAELEEIKDQIEAATGGLDDDGEGASAEEEMADIPEYDEEDAPKLESRNARVKVLKEYKNLRSRYARLAKLSERLLTKHKSLSESSRKGESPALKEAIGKANRMEVAVREMSARYNQEMIEMASFIWQKEKPELWETHKADLSKCTEWSDFEKLSEKIILENAPKQEPQKSLKESVEPKPEPKEEPKTESQKQEPKGGSLHEGVVGAQLSMINRARRHQ